MIPEREDPLEAGEAVSEEGREPPPAPSSELKLDGLELRLELDRRINYALQQNAVPPLKRLVVEHRGEGDLEELELRIRSEPAFAREHSVVIDRVVAGTDHVLENLTLELSPAYLGALRERVAGTLTFELFLGERRVLVREEAVELLAREEWSGLASLPEILAAFVLPNHPTVEELLARAASVLERWTGDPSLSGYQTRDRERVARTTAAIYQALVEQELSYVSPPASFESAGQKVRLPGRIFETGMATCLDLALLAAACLEQAGLHPLLLVVKDHAFAGVWLGEETFPEPALDDGARIKKLVELGEVLAFDSTGVTARPALTFEQSVAEARRRLERPGEFHCAVDVARARRGGLRPLPEPVEPVEPGEGAESEAAIFPPAGPSAPGLPELGIAAPRAARESVAPVEETPASRLDRWKRKLLDLSLRNRLLNFRETKTTVPLLCPDLAALEDALADGETFQLRPRPDELGPGDPRRAAFDAQRAGELDELLRSELASRRLSADLGQASLERRLLEMYRQARREREEGGVSALYLALGFLEWTESSASRRRLRAPILLLPLELTRRTVRSGFALRLADEDPRVNVTLLEMLRADHGIAVLGLDPLPGDESGVDVAEVLQSFRRAVLEVERWDVKETAAIGFFSFSKFLMWRDLSERADTLLENRIVAHLVERPGEAFEAELEFPEPERLDEEYAPADACCPLPTDSSQLAAIFAATAGRSFVLEGPPGTGKSQTITNLIAHALGQGKTVLFVSEKMAALEVVRARLDAIGLGPFCLELHSNKTAKRHVAEQLGAALDLVRDASEEDWRREAERLASLRGELNAYVESLHAVRESGESLYQGISRLVGLRGAKRLGRELPRLAGAGELAGARERIAGLRVADDLSELPVSHPWRAARRCDWSAVWSAEVERALPALREATEDFAARVGPIAARLCLEGDDWSLAELTLLAELATLLVGAPAPPAELLVRSDWEAIREELEGCIAHGRRRGELREEVFGHFEERVLELDLEALRAKQAQAESSWWPLSWLRRRAVSRALAVVSRGGEAPGREGIGAALDRALDLRAEERWIGEAGAGARALVGRAWRDGEPNWSELAELIAWAGSLRRVALRLSGTDYERAVSLRTGWARLAAEGAEGLAPEGAPGGELTRFTESFAAWQEARGAVEELLELDRRRAFGEPDERTMLARTAEAVRGWEGSVPRLREWCAWQRARRAGIEAGLEALVLALEEGELVPGELREAFDRAWYERWTAEGIDAEPALKNFFRQEHERRITDFRRVDGEYLRLTGAMVVARLAERVPRAGSRVLPNSEVGILRRELQKKRRHKSVRTLFREIPNLLPRIKPCLLMSPLSVAQYLDPDHPPFDLVVFDEASQIPVWDAIGAIARGSQAVVVGDPKQLPPTSFFQRGDSEEEEEDPAFEASVEDLESILDECLASGIPCRPLDWHYRSRHESLIAFSNHHYYDGRLLTFPSPRRDGLGVHWRHVEGGVYDKGNTRTNRREAERVVAEIVERLRDPLRSAESIGVVTFNQAQQTLIEDILEELRGEDPEIDAHFAEDAREAVFVKNLENVQGDERDVILFSITYGPDSAGKVSMNFGPMNRDGGERRLNVAITRARREVVVFSTLRPEDIDLVRTQARGVSDLRAFLEYARQGPEAAARQGVFRPGARPDAPLEEAVADALREAGWEVHREVGCSGYRLDLAVLDPDRPGRYLLGVECDGASYRQGQTARDRDLLRHAVLGGLGWKVHRVWSSDWWSDPAGELQRIQAALGAGSGPSVEPPPPAPPGEEAEEEVDEPRAGREGPSSPRVTSPPKLEVYSPLPRKEPLGTPEEFFLKSSNRRLRGLLLRVVRREGPISLDLAARRLAACWGLEQVRAKVLDRVREMIPERVLVREAEGTEFLWPEGLDPQSWRGFRVAGEDPASVREREDLPLEEIQNAGLHVLRSAVSAPLEDLARETARLFGYSRLGSALRSRMVEGLERLVAEGLAVREGDSLVVAPQGEE